MVHKTLRDRVGFAALFAVNVLSWSFFNQKARPPLPRRSVSHFRGNDGQWSSLSLFCAKDCRPFNTSSFEFSRSLGSPRSVAAGHPKTIGQCVCVTDDVFVVRDPGRRSDVCAKIFSLSALRFYELGFFHVLPELPRPPQTLPDQRPAEAFG